MAHRALAGWVGLLGGAGRPLANPAGGHAGRVPPDERRYGPGVPPGMRLPSVLARGLSPSGGRRAGSPPAAAAPAPPDARAARPHPDADGLSLTGPAAAGRMSPAPRTGSPRS